MMNLGTTYGELVDTTLARLFGDGRSREYGGEVVTLLKVLDNIGTERLPKGQSLAYAAAYLLQAAGYAEIWDEPDGIVVEITNEGRDALHRISR